MGLPIPSDTYEILASLSKEEKIQVIAWMAGSLVSKEETRESEIPTDVTADTDWPPKHVRFGEDLSGKKPWYAGIKQAKELNEEDKIAIGRKLAGAWADTPDDLAEQIMSSRTISTREINLDD